MTRCLSNNLSVGRIVSLVLQCFMLFSMHQTIGFTIPSAGSFKICGHYAYNTCNGKSLYSADHLSRQSAFLRDILPNAQSFTRQNTHLINLRIGATISVNTEFAQELVKSSIPDPPQTSNIVLSLISALVGVTTASLVFQTKSIIFGVNRSILTKIPYVLPMVAGVMMALLIKVEPNVKKSLVLPVGDYQHQFAKYQVMWRQLLFRWLGAIISMGGGVALGTAGMSAEIGMLVTYLLLLGLSPILNITSSQRRMLLLSASAAGAAANFNAPITGVIYALEVTSKLLPFSALDTRNDKEKEKDNKVQLLLMAVAALFSALYIRSGYFASPFKPSLDWDVGLGFNYHALQALTVYGVCGVLSGLLFKSFAAVRSSFGKLYSRFGDISGPLIAGVITAATGSPQSIPAGFVVANKIVANTITTSESLNFFISKFLAVASAGMSGFMGGQIAPLIFVGSGFGALIHRTLSIWAPRLLEGQSINAFGVICGAAMVGCNFNNIFFPAILVAEMTRSMEPTLGILLATSMASLIVNLK